MSQIEPDSKLKAPKLSTSIPTKIPPSLYQFFWDVDAKKLDPSQKPYFVIQRLLDKGDVEAVRWVRENFSVNEISQTFYQIRDFQARVGDFWSEFLHLNREKVLCLQPHYLQMRKTHWPY